MDNENDDAPVALDLLDGPPSPPAAAPEPADPEPAKPEPASGFDAKAFASVLKEHFPPAKATEPAEPPMSPEDAKKALNFWEPTDEWLVKYDNLETRKAAILEMRDGQMRQFDTIAQARLAHMQQAMDQQYAPLRARLEQQDTEARESRFNNRFPDLAKPELKDFRDTIIHGLAAKGAFAQKSEDDIFKLIASTAESIIRQGNPAFKLTPAGSTPSGQQKQSGHALRPTRAGSGGGGGGQAPGKTDGKPLAISLLS